MVEGISPLDESPYELFNSTFKARYLHMSKRSVTRMDAIVFSLEQMQTNTCWEMFCEGNNFSTSVSSEKALRIEKKGSFLIISPRSVVLRDIGLEL